MSKKELHSFRLAIKRGPDRSPLFWWLVDQYDELTGEGSSRRQDWADHCQRMARLGVVDAKGKPPNAEAARKAWQVVRKEVAAERAKRSPPKPRELPARRPSASWEPSLAAVPRVAPEARAGPSRGNALEEDLPPRRPPLEPPAHAPPSVSKKMTIEDLTPEARAQIESLRQDFAATDRKRFGRF